MATTFTEQWQVIQPGCQRHYPGDGCCLMAWEHKYDFVTPTGRHVTGEAVNINSAKRRAIAEHQKWILQQWPKGHSRKGNMWQVPLT